MDTWFIIAKVGNFKSADDLTSGLGICLDCLKCAIGRSRCNVMGVYRHGACRYAWVHYSVSDVIRVRLPKCQLRK